MLLGLLYLWPAAADIVAPLGVGSAMAHDHDHPTITTITTTARSLSETALRVKALESLLVEKGLVDPAALDAIVDAYENKIGPRNGARVVARAWTDPDYKARLLTDATAAIAELGYSGAQGEHMVVVENTPPSITSSSARSAPAIRGRCSACRRSGTSPPPIARAP